MTEKSRWVSVKDKVMRAVKAAPAVGHIWFTLAGPTPQQPVVAQPGRPAIVRSAEPVERVAGHDAKRHKESRTRAVDGATSRAQTTSQPFEPSSRRSTDHKAHRTQRSIETATDPRSTPNPRTSTPQERKRTDRAR